MGIMALGIIQDYRFSGAEFIVVAAEF